jgi:zinc and cadmium transporter
MSSLLLALLAGLAVSFVALIGFACVVLFNERALNTFLLWVIPLAAGSLIGTAFFHLLPESVEAGGPTFIMAAVGLGFFFVLDSGVWLYHCHGPHRHHGHGGEHGHAAGLEHGHACPVKPVGILSLVGDMVHNVTDGVVIASAFLVSPILGLFTTLAAILHEIPQEVGDFGVLLRAGFEKKRALRWNFFAALTILIGIVGVFIAQPYAQNMTAYTVPFAAGSFLYIALTNLLPDLKEEMSARVRIEQGVIFFLSIGLMYAATFVEI